MQLSIHEASVVLRALDLYAAETETLLLSPDHADAASAELHDIANLRQRLVEFLSPPIPPVPQGERHVDST